MRRVTPDTIYTTIEREGIPFKELAAEMQMPVSEISRMLASNNEIQVSQVWRIAEAFGSVKARRSMQSRRANT